MFTHTAYFIETLTNTHVGSGDTTFGIADLVIQKDPTTSLPVFHPSSVKGAVKDHFESYLGDNQQAKGSDRVKESTFHAIFGAPEAQNFDELGKEEMGDSKISEAEIKLLKRAPQHGLLKFYEARLLTMPLRSSLRVYHNGTSPAAVLDYLDALEGFGVARNGGARAEIAQIQAFFQELSKKLERNPDVEFLLMAPVSQSLMIEEYEKGEVCEPEGPLPGLLARYLSPHCTSDFVASLAVFRDSIFQEICDSGLPIIARNSLDEKGISKNLFYEEVLPRRSVLWFMTGAYHLFSDGDAPAFQEMFNFFEKKLVNDPIQMGANASIGYGMIRLSKLGGEKKGGVE